MFKSPKGTKDVFGERQKLVSLIESKLRNLAQCYHFEEIVTPIFEFNDLFNHSIGNTSSIVTKQMYTFKDKKGRQFVLRPEATTAIIRAFLQHKLFHQSLPYKCFYYGPMFRYEQPQKGRQRQFTQFGVEIIGHKSPKQDLEIIVMAQQILNDLKLSKTKLLLNSLGDAKTKEVYTKVLRKYLTKFKQQLSQISLQRLSKNPLRILDDPQELAKPFMQKVPKISQYYSLESQAYFDQLKKQLKQMQIEYQVSDHLVRGLDYYSEIIFEFVATSETIGSQATLIAGGRYDNLVSQMGGPKLSGIGFALGVERVANELEALKPKLASKLDIYVVDLLNSNQNIVVSQLIFKLRQNNFKVETNYLATKFTKLLARIKRLNPKFIIIFDPEIYQDDLVEIKFGVNCQNKLKLKLTQVEDYLKGNIN